VAYIFRDRVTLSACVNGAEIRVFLSLVSEQNVMKLSAFSYGIRPERSIV